MWTAGSAQRRRRGGAADLPKKIGPKKNYLFL
jgi:hypothetical protein